VRKCFAFNKPLRLCCDVDLIRRACFFNSQDAKGVLMNKIIAFGCLLFAMIISGLACTPLPPQTDRIVIWHWMTDRDKAFQELAARYEQETGVKVIFELYAPSDVYAQKIISAAQARILPDIFGILSKKSVVADFIKSGFVADLTADFKAEDAQWERSIFDKALAVNRFEENNAYHVPPGIYGVPIDVTNVQMLYNKNLLKKSGILKPPATIDEWIEDTAVLKRVGLSGFISGWGELWMMDCFASNYAFNMMGEEKVMATFRGDIPYTDASWIEVFQLFADLRSQGVFATGIVTKSNKDAEQDFALERAAFAFNGSWCVNVYRDMNPNLEYGIMLPPVANSDHPMRIWGGAGSSFLVNKNSVNQQKAVAFLKWLTAKEQQVYLAEKIQSLPVNKTALVNISPVLKGFAASMDVTTHPTIWPLNEDALVLEIFDRGLQSIVIGEKTPAQVAAEVQKVKVRQLIKQNKRKQS
jgi:ABC-type glycerol-3-phosphate transport system substrate-binding protein